MVSTRRNKSQYATANNNNVEVVREDNESSSSSWKVFTERRSTEKCIPEQMPGRVLSSESEGSGSGSAVSNTQPTTAAKKMAKNKVRKAVKISKSQKVSNVSEVKNNGRRVTTRAQSSAESQVNLLPGIDDVVLPNKTPKLPKKKISRDESVTKVKLLTGTLYIYRGKTRRAEFVRTK